MICNLMAKLTDFMGKINRKIWVSFNWLGGSLKNILSFYGFLCLCRQINDFLWLKTEPRYLENCLATQWKRERFGGCGIFFYFWMIFWSAHHHAWCAKIDWFRWISLVCLLDLYLLILKKNKLKIYQDVVSHKIY